MLEFGRQGSSILQSTADYNFSVVYPFFSFLCIISWRKIKGALSCCFFSCRKNLDNVIDFLLGDSRQNLLFCWVILFVNLSMFFAIS